MRPRSQQGGESKAVPLQGTLELLTPEPRSVVACGSRTNRYCWCIDMVSAAAFLLAPGMPIDLVEIGRDAQALEK